MTDDNRTTCPIPHQGYCVYQRCSYWDEAKQECTGLCFSDHNALEEVAPTEADGPCTIYWTEDYD